MYTFETQFSGSPLNYQARLTVDGPVIVFSSRRERSMLDHRFTPGRAAPASKTVSLCLLLDGTMTWIGGPHFAGESALVQPSSVIEGALGRRTSLYRSGGPSFAMVEVRAPHNHLHAPSASPTNIDVAPRVFEVARAYSRASAEDATRCCDDLLSALREEKILLPHERDQSARGALSETAHRAVEMICRRGNVLDLTREQLATSGGISVRTLQRVLMRIALAINVPWLGWREFSHCYRLQVAVALLSNPSISVADVAATAGYATSQGLLQAMRSSGLPSPTEVRHLIMSYEPPTFLDGEA